MSLSWREGLRPLPTSEEPGPLPSRHNGSCSEEENRSGPCQGKLPKAGWGGSFLSLPVGTGGSRQGQTARAGDPADVSPQHPGPPSHQSTGGCSCPSLSYPPPLPQTPVTAPRERGGSEG